MELDLQNLTCQSPITLKQKIQVHFFFFFCTTLCSVIKMLYAPLRSLNIISRRQYTGSSKLDPVFNLFQIFHKSGNKLGNEMTGCSVHLNIKKETRIYTFKQLSKIAVGEGNKLYRRSRLWHQFELKIIFQPMLPIAPWIIGD